MTSSSIAATTTALVTGASLGIGRALVQQLAKLGYSVVGCARNEKALQDLLEESGNAKKNIRIHKCDVSREEEVLGMFEMIDKEMGGLDICVNNAGIAFDAPLLTGSTTQWRDMMEVNVIGLCIVTREAVKSMKLKGGDNCCIMNVNSVQGHIDHRVLGPNRSVYIGTKHAVSGITASLRNELRLANLGSTIRVMQISPGLVETNFAVHSSGLEQAELTYSKIKALEAKDVADSIIHALTSPAHVTVAEVIIYPKESHK